ncbi:MerR family transcriptional regulator [Anaerovorax odorimutans]|uniref:MerR family transcriptional regulator n=1 Tax=Anaerovorax odorimutans TaxID=109327 RepID=A0ABT1RN14_9FIRM|nr:MerR family transcriptional regulator [Anaerovorax odorimutans]MCQ4636569.1 MerR family transcriptional regulator [Anaerovorax odorimutans]
MDKTYSTSEVAKIIGIHPNTVRLYEELELISRPRRQPNGYRIFTRQHIEQFQIARLAFQVEVLQNGLRKQAVRIIKAAARNEFSEAIVLTQEYLQQVEREQKNAEEAIEITEGLFDRGLQEDEDASLRLTRKETADLLCITIDTLRNWELNGLLSVKRKHNGYRVYTDRDIRRLKIIRSLRCANYSLASILRMLRAVDVDPGTDIKAIIDTPKAGEDIISACDQLLSSLSHAKKNFQVIERRLCAMRKYYPTVYHQT